ncbi:MAG: AraC family transcriptional regulator, partial [Flavobacteriales bacterium]|nr:AraC family transcriptional regulator [Flavobacteriales bacterium]
YGPYEASGDVWMGMDRYIQCNGIEMNGAPFEMYVTDPMQEPDTAKWLTEIVYPVEM